MERSVFTEKTLQIEVEETTDTVHLRWTGRSNEREPGRFLAPILDRALASAEASGKLLVLDFRALDYMNSSTFTPLVRLMESARTGLARVRMVYRSGLKWQQLSFSAMKVFETLDRRIELRGE
ncbi:MAG: hypothetical protein AB2A00_30515 [Myxococcota bacterium]